MPRKPASAEVPEPETATPQPPQDTGNRFFSWLRSIDIRREPGWIGGVCAGIAARLGIDPLIVRGIAVVIAVLGGPAILLYAAAWLLLPDASNKIHLEEVIRGRLEPAIAGIAAFFVLSLLPVTQGFWFAGAGFWGEPNWAPSIGRALWTIALVGALVWFVVWLARRGNTPPVAAPTDATTTAAFVASETTVSPPTGATEPEMAQWREKQAQVRAEQDAFRNQQASERAAANRAANEEAQRLRAAQREKDRAAYAATRSHPLYSLVAIGLALVAGGIATVSTADGTPTTASIVLGLAVTLAVLAVAIIVNGVRGKRSGGAAGVAWVLLVPLVLSSGVLGGQVGWAPRTALTPTDSKEYYFGGGNVELDLTEVRLPSSGPGAFGKEINLYLGAGRVTVTVPDGVSVRFSGAVAAGAIDAGEDENSRRVGPVEWATADYGPDDVTQLIVSVQVGAGQITVLEEGDNR